MMNWVNKLNAVDEASDWIERSKTEVGGIVDVPAGESGDWRIEPMTLDEEESIRTMFQFKDRMVPPGTYTRLIEGPTLYMSDTPSEIADHIPLINAVQREGGGDILIFGLGIGLVMEMLMDMHDGGYCDINSVTFVEKSPDVIALVAPHYREKYPDHFKLIEADALELTPTDEHYDAVWFDIWPSSCADDGDDARFLMDTWRESTDWMGVWQAETILAGDEEAFDQWMNS